MRTSLLVGLLGLATATPMTLPTYSYAIRSQDFVQSGPMLSAVNVIVPNTVWRCFLSYAEAGIVARCSAPQLGEAPVEVQTSVSCKATDSDGAKLRLATLDGRWATVYIGCRRDPLGDESSDGF
jgi:hypothetical protein